MKPMKIKMQSIDLYNQRESDRITGRSSMNEVLDAFKDTDPKLEKTLMNIFNIRFENETRIKKIIK